MLYSIVAIAVLVVLIMLFRNTPLFGNQSLAQRFQENLANARAERDARHASKSANP
ncbi:hypothetical protein [Burkholderia pseudomallei]|uniref:hypothetical protein n=1 Tax=Burkholderia pseudomallei TaxID=28450 RepID=UPI000F2A16CF|nr:hypothetical protein [Burkholderia pseudomallei]VBG63254.1 Uncharacterised protein [Burkholderia pseudomallei]